MYTTTPQGMILLVDDDANITDLLKFNLSSEGFGVEIKASATDVITDDLKGVRLIIVDAMNQRFNGIELTKQIKANPNSEHIPVIICTERDSEDVIIDAFEAGVDDVVSKPFSLRELIARIKAILRRHPLKAPSKSEPIATRNIQIKHLRLYVDLDNQKVIEDGIVVPLTKTEYAILAYLLKNQNSFFTRNEICTEVWKDEAGDNARIVDTNISRLRKKLGESGKYIINRYGMGYAFVDKVS